MTNEDILKELFATTSNLIRVLESKGESWVHTKRARLVQLQAEYNSNVEMAEIAKSKPFKKQKFTEVVVPVVNVEEKSSSEIEPLE